MKNYNKYIESPYLMYLDMNNLNGWRMSEDFIKNCDDNSDKRMYSWSRCIFWMYSLKIRLNIHDVLTFFAERKKMKKSNKLACDRCIE